MGSPYFKPTGVCAVACALFIQSVASCSGSGDFNPPVDAGSMDSTFPDSAGDAEGAATDGWSVDADGGTSPVVDASPIDAANGVDTSVSEAGDAAGNDASLGDASDGAVTDSGGSDGPALDAGRSDGDAAGAMDAADAADTDGDGIDAASLPSSVDWRSKGVVGPVENGGMCAGGFTAIAVNGGLEGTHKIEAGVLLRLSPQALVDCDGLNCTDGGAAASLAVGTNLPAASAYPYTAQDGTCKSFTPVLSIQQVTPLSAHDDNQVMEALANSGPLFVEVHDDASFMSYAGGMYAPPSCSTPAVSASPGTLVGYAPGVDGGADYWIVRMPFGASWGASGYAYIQKGPGICAFDQAIVFVGG